MPKPGEKHYFKKIGAAGIRHSLNKPFSDAESGALTIQFGAILMLLPPPPATILDLGCGTGWTSCLLARRGYTVVGQDLAPDAIEHARAYARRHGITGVTFVASDFEHLPYRGKFEAAVFFDSLHHSVDEVAALKTVHRALKPQGICIASEPGAGHTNDPHTQAAADEFGVTERDMPPRLIKRSGRRAGFRRFEVYADPALLARAAFRQAASPAKRRLLATPIVGGLIRALSAAYVLTLKRRSWGLVVLGK